MNEVTHMAGTALLVHGFNVRDNGAGTIARLSPYLLTRGSDTVVFRMGWMEIVQVYTQNKRHAKRLAEAARNAKLNDRSQPVIALGHSNGCAVIHLATTLYDAPIDKIAYLNPALEKQLAPGEQVQCVDVWYSPSDTPVKWARWLPKHVWGEMGRTGYVGDDPRMINHNKQDDYLVSSKKHSDFARAEKLTYFAPLIINQLVHGL